MDDQKDLIRNLLVAAAVFVAVMLLLPKILPTPPQQPANQPDTPASTTPAAPGETPAPNPASTGEVAQTSPTAGVTGSGTPPGTAAASPAGQPPAFTVAEAPEIARPVIGADLAQPPEGRHPPHPPEQPYRMRLVLCNEGAAIESAGVADSWKNLEDPDFYPVLAPVVTGADQGLSETTWRSLAIESINIDNRGPLSLYDKRWHVRELAPTASEQSVEFSLDILQADQPVLRLVRRYALAPSPRKTGRYDLAVSFDVQNLSGQPHRVVLCSWAGLGTCTESFRIADQFLDVGIQHNQTVAGQRKRLPDLTKAAGLQIEMFQPTQLAEGRRLAWVATDNSYFTCTVAPLSASGTDQASYISAVTAVDLDGVAVTTEDRTLRLVTQPQDIPAGQTLQLPADVYLGPKLMSTFKSVEPYASRNYYYQISQSYGYCTFHFLVELMTWLLNTLEHVFFNYGVAIIALVIIVRGLLHPLTKKGQLNMVRMQHRMQELQPKIEEIKRKYANDKNRMNQEMMKLNLNPAGQALTCLPMLIQMPIWVALWLSLSNNVLMRHEPFFWWIRDLAAPDHLYVLAHAFTIPLVGWEVGAINLLPLLLGVFMYTQQKLTPRPKPAPGASEQQVQQQEAMQKMMPLMSIMMLVIFYKAPSGLTLYIMSSSLFGTIEQYLIRNHIKKLEAEGRLHKAPKPPSKDDDNGRSAPRKPGFLDKLQKMAEDAQRQAQSGKVSSKRDKR